MDKDKLNGQKQIPEIAVKGSGEEMFAGLDKYEATMKLAHWLKGRGVSPDVALRIAQSPEQGQVIRVGYRPEELDYLRQSHQTSLHAEKYPYSPNRIDGQPSTTHVVLPSQPSRILMALFRLDKTNNQR